MRTFPVTFQLAMFLIIFIEGQIFAQKDSEHYSDAFKATKPFRIFLPADYTLSQKRYGVIYFLHGNFGTHEFELEGVNQLVNEHNIILVALNGRSIPSDRRPYNIGDHEDVKYSVQFKDYILELITHIDSAYRTLPDRAHRAFMGHSMGGFMSFVLAGKYPHLVGTAVDIKGAPEFFIGYPDHHTLYSLRHMFKNLFGVHLRFHNSTVDELVNLNKEVHQGALREKGLSYTYEIYAGGHDYTTKEFAEACKFIVSKFNDPLPRPLRWHHADTYPDFDVWDYSVKSNLRQPGFIEMKGVSKGGMKISTRKWQPDGPLIPDVRIDITTAPVYQPKTAYTLFDFNETQNKKQQSVIRSDAEGRIGFSLNHEIHHIGIYKKNDLPDIVFVEHTVNEKGIFLDHYKSVRLKLRLLNRGGRAPGKIKVILSTSTEGVNIQNPTVDGDNILPGELQWLPTEFTVTAANKPTEDGSPFMIRFNIAIADDKGNTWQDEFDAPVFYDVPAFTKIGIDDWDKSPLGVGNGNMIPEPGETIMIYQGSHRTRLYSDDPYISHVHLHDELTPDKWGGDGFKLSSFIHISKDCPVGHQIKFLASYEEKEWKTIKRNVTWGTSIITIGKEPDYNAKYGDWVERGSNGGPMDTILLKDYSPKSSVVTPVTFIAKARYGVIDAHSHPYARTPEEVMEWVKTMDEVGVEMTVVLTGATGAKFDSLVDMYLKPHPGRFQLYCGMDYTNIDKPDYPQRVVAELVRCYNKGARGVGEWTDKGLGYTHDPTLTPDKRLHPDDPRLQAFWEKCAELKLPVSFHIADHPSAWKPPDRYQERSPDYQQFNRYGKDGLTYEELLVVRNRALEKHPSTIFIACHLANQGNDLAALGKVLDLYPNLYVDISARDYEIGRTPRATLKFLTKYTPRILMGTDLGREKHMYQAWWKLLESEDEFMEGRIWWRYYGVGLPSPVLKSLYGDNARRILNWKK